MVQRGLVEAIMDLLITNGKVFLQSDIETVTTRMKHLFITYGKGKLVVDGDERDWMENPFGVRTDWEQHVIERGAPMWSILEIVAATCYQLKLSVVFKYGRLRRLKNQRVVK
ncbi:phosphoglycerate kinase [Musa troglodytarum]|uniref:tRNA (guanine(46)-N(7))-methyltransferase n=1 Tax=Musa troglodytarum TaxID=320322 RepID=A0A9E7GRK9_9LILI|nr:phosphoglycerate kinase [Musa troglodytarum]